LVSPADRCVILAAPKDILDDPTLFLNRELAGAQIAQTKVSVQPARKSGPADRGSQGHFPLILLTQESTTELGGGLRAIRGPESFKGRQQCRRGGVEDVASVEVDGRHEKGGRREASDFEQIRL
jgi:hypothetical protein